MLNCLIAWILSFCPHFGWHSHQHVLTWWNRILNDNAFGLDKGLKFIARNKKNDFEIRKLRTWDNGNFALTML